MNKFAATFAVLMAGVSMPALANAQDMRPATADATQSDAPASQLDDVVVTARKTRETVQTVPVSITVVSGEQLARQQVVEIRDLQKTSASLQFGAPGSAPGGGAILRGIGTVGFSRGAEASVGIVVDGVVQGNTNINNLFDINRVEVLRGPQGTLFGQSTSAGVINISTVAPSFDRVSGRVSTELSGDGVLGAEFGRQVVRAAVNLPLSENQAVRISAFGNRTTGVNDNKFRGTEDENTERGIRGRYLGQFGSNITVNVIGDYNKSTISEGQFQVPYYVAPGSRLEAYLAACGVTAGPDNVSTCGGDENRLTNNETYGGSAQVDIDLGSATLTSVTSIRRQNQDFMIDVDGLPDNVTSLNVASAGTTAYKQFTQELRLSSNGGGSFNYVAGAFYQKAETLNNQLTGVTIDLSKVAPFLPRLPQTRGAAQQAGNLTNIAAFGEIRGAVTDRLTLFAGARVNRSEVEDSSFEQDRTAAPFGPFRTAGASFSETKFTGRLGAQYQFSRSLMAYGSAATGYKGAQIADLDADVPALIVLPEEPTSYELGLKSNLFDNRLAANVNLFYSDVKNYQAQRCTVDSVNNQLVCSPLNVSQVITKGIEGDIFGHIGDNLTLNGNFIYNNAEYPSDFGAFAGQQVAYAPRYKFTISGEYARPIGNLELFASADGTYRSATRLTIERPTADQIYKSSFIVGGRIGVRATDRWTVALFAKNIGNVPVPSSFATTLPVPLNDTQDTAIWAFRGQQSRRLVGLQADFQF